MQLAGCILYGQRLYMRMEAADGIIVIVSYFHNLEICGSSLPLARVLITPFKRNNHQPRMIKKILKRISYCNITDIATR